MSGDNRLGFMLKQITIDVTNLTPTQRKQIYKKHYNQQGFKQFNKTTTNHKTTYNFTYQN